MTFLLNYLQVQIVTRSWEFEASLNIAFPQRGILGLLREPKSDGGFRFKLDTSGYCESGSGAWGILIFTFLIK